MCHLFPTLARNRLGPGSPHGLGAVAEEQTGRVHSLEQLLPCSAARLLYQVYQTLGTDRVLPACQSQQGHGRQCCFIAALSRYVWPLFGQVLGLFPLSFLLRRPRWVKSRICPALASLNPSQSTTLLRLTLGHFLCQ